jgi:signal transduction histidine kinase/ligand-binding sensor domain-containing protein
LVSIDVTADDATTCSYGLRLVGGLMNIRRWITTAAAMASVLAPEAATALDPQVRLTQYRHTVWRVQDGYFASAPHAIAQTADGYIWIGTGAGLVKYDGVRFTPWVRPGETRPFTAAVYSLLGSSDGTLWIGTASRLLSLRNDKVEEHVVGRINAIIEDRQHRIWVARSRPPDSAGGLCQIAGEKPRCVGGDDRLRLPYAVTLSEEADGHLWVGSSGQLLRWRDDSHRSYFRGPLARFEGLQAVASVIVAGDGVVWAAIPREGFGVFRILDDAPSRVTFMGARAANVNRLFEDRDRSMWMGTSNDGIYRVSGERIDRFGSDAGLSSNAVTGFFEDREGSLWVATSKGLDRFRDSRVLTFSTAEGLSADLAGSVLAGDDGRVWIANKGALDVIEGDTVRSIRLPGQNVTSLLQDHARRLWVGLDNELAIYQGRRFSKVTSRDGSSLIGAVISMTEDRDGDIWASVVGATRRLLRIRDMQVQEEFSTDQIPSARVVAADPAGGIWLGLLDGQLGHYYRGQFETVPLQLGETPVLNLMIDGDGSVWASSALGLARVKDREVKNLTAKNGLPCDAITGAIRDRENTLWLYAKCGLIAIDDAEAERWSRQPDTTTLQYRVFDTLDGAMPDASSFRPGLSKSPDGRLWFVNDAVLQMIDPGALRMNTVVPPVHVEALRVDRHDYGSAGLVNLPARSRDIEISYTALSLAVPEKVRFRYRLDGRDREWHDAGTRRQAFYSDLPPGEYRFQVTASNHDGVWNEQGATLSFAIAPAYYQTTWFLVAAAGMVAAIALTAHRVRVRIVERRQQDISALNERLMKAQEQERVRIAGELHDGVMQEMLAATMMLGSAKRHAVGGSPVQSAIDKVQQKLIRVGTDLRQLSHGLHPPALQDAGLPNAVRDYCDEFSATSGIPVSCETDPAVDDLSRGSALALFRILQEALGNAAKHAQAAQITVQLARAGALVSLVIADDGVGFDRHRLPAMRGLGLITMRERAGQLSGRLEVQSAPGRGTTVRVVMPFR